MNGITYDKAGVNINCGNDLVSRIKRITADSPKEGSLSGVGGFASLFELSGYKHPILVSGTDGVGTKVMVAQEVGDLSTIGIDLVAMCVNDILCCGAKPLFFLDYYACGTLDVDDAERVIQGIKNGCDLAGCILAGGETAEMPGLYSRGDFDLAGFTVGAVEKEKIIDGKGIKPGDSVIALDSSGLHSNGFSLVRHIIKDWSEPFENTTLGEYLLKPTTIYVETILSIIEEFTINGLCHVTGGGIPENLIRIIPKGMGAEISKKEVSPPPIFDLLAERGADAEDMWRTFNMGAGFLVVSPPAQTEGICVLLNDFNARPVGKIVDGRDNVCLM